MDVFDVGDARAWKGPYVHIYMKPFPAFVVVLGTVGACFGPLGHLRTSAGVSTGTVTVLLVLLIQY
jgi:hypothetical protein